MGIRTWQGASFPLVVPITAVAVIDWEVDDDAGPKVGVVSVHFGDLVVARDEIPMECIPGSGTNLLSAPYFQAQQPGTYVVRLRVDGDEIASRDIDVSSVMPSL
jgi:hypothetical protein